MSSTALPRKASRTNVVAASWCAAMAITLGVWSVKARIPEGMTAARPRPAPRAASLLLRIGASFESWLNVTRSTTSTIFIIAPGGTRSVG